jgi:hypothetical protein
VSRYAMRAEWVRAIEGPADEMIRGCLGHDDRRRAL